MYVLSAAKETLEVRTFLDDKNASTEPKKFLSSPRSKRTFVEFGRCWYWLVGSRVGCTTVVHIYIFVDEENSFGRFVRPVVARD